MVVLEDNACSNRGKWDGAQGGEKKMRISWTDI